MCSLTESLSTVGPQSLLAECLYLKGLPEESSHLAWNTDGSHITAAGGCKLHGLDCHGNWAGLVFEVEGRETQKKKER